MLLPVMLNDAFAAAADVTFDAVAVVVVDGDESGATVAVDLRQMSPLSVSIAAPW
jgi:hypothetical protein